MRLLQNMDSLNIYNRYKKNLDVQSKIMNRISTGSKINSSKDNPNKMGVRENLRIQLKGIQMAERNIQDGISMLQAADGVLSSMNESLIRIKELTVQAGGVNSEEDLQIIQNEINQLKDSIDQMASNAEFNGVKLLSNKSSDNNNPTTLKHMVGANVGDNMEIPLYNITSENIFGGSLDINNGIGKSLEAIDGAINIVNSIRSKFGAIQSRLETSYENIQETTLNLQHAESRISDADLALEMADFARTSILSDTSTALMHQSNNFPQDVLRVLENMK
ncbi:flagellin [Clostridium isatidis]|uniref:Flagellin n=1 Tax=Clostridium isatidis TaxID=182773 RepID=A0A343JC47_9CLOT|nr:flagellin [Clostridium isatidis]ASW43105.1 flagellin [Clostridium isatidis]